MSRGHKERTPAQLAILAQAREKAKIVIAERAKLNALAKEEAVSEDALPSPPLPPPVEPVSEDSPPPPESVSTPPPTIEHEDATLLHSLFTLTYTPRHPQTSLILPMLVRDDVAMEAR